MSLAELSAVGELVASVAVVITLIYLAIQIRQANALARAQTRQRMVDQAQQEIYKGLIEEPSIFRSFYKAEALTETERIQLAGFLIAAMRQREYEWFQKRDGHLDEALWTAYRGVILLHLGTPRTRQWWLDSGRAVFDPEFSAMVDQLLEGREPSTAYFERIQHFDGEA
jgi:hypothetical protein